MIKDRSKDVIKSGGEWISTVELENALMAHPAIAEAAVIAIPDEKWAERPLACVVLREGATATADELREFLAPNFAKWWLPDRFEFLPGDPEDGRRQVPQDRACASSSPRRRLPRSALVTGGRSGIGAAIVAALERDGADVQVLDLVDGFDVSDPRAWDVGRRGRPRVSERRRRRGRGRRRAHQRRAVPAHRRRRTSTASSSACAASRR